METNQPVVIDAPQETERHEAAPSLASQGTYKITTPDGREFEFPGLATAPDGSITLASLIDLLLVLVASIDHPVVDQILQANDIVQKDVRGQLYYPRPRKAVSQADIVL
jgi:hypothetical protein